jgi:uncharacterized phiE125 gp8 family phage protein
MTYWTVTPAASLPITMTEIRDQLRISGEDEDSLLAMYARAATAHIETVLNRPIITQTISQIVPAFPPRWPIELHGRVQQVVSISYLDQTGVSQTLAPEVYRVNTYSEPGLVSLQIDQAWPNTALRDDAVTITYKAGFGDDSDSVPDALRQAILLLTAHWFENRVSVVIGANVTSLPFGIDCLIAPWKVWSF